MAFSSSYSSSNTEPDIQFDIAWLEDDADEIMEIIQDDERSSVSADTDSATSKILEQWKKEDESLEDTVAMDVGECHQYNSFFCDNPMIYDPVNSCASPVGPIEELILVGLEDVTENIFLPAAEDLPKSAAEGYRDSFRKLAESMKRSHESRLSLTHQAWKRAAFEQTEESSSQLQAILAASIKC